MKGFVDYWLLEDQKHDKNSDYKQIDLMMKFRN